MKKNLKETILNNIMNMEAYLSVFGKSQIDNDKIKKFVDEDNGYDAMWDEINQCWNFPTGGEDSDHLQRTLQKIFNKLHIRVSFESNLEESKQFKLADVARKILKENVNETNTNQYNTDLNSILEDDANNDLMSKINAKDYNNFFTCLQKLDNNATESAIDVGDSYFPIDDLSQGIEYLEQYLKHFKNSQCKTFILSILNKIK